MAKSPDLKVYTHSGEYVAACKHAEDAAAILALYGDGATIRASDHRRILYRNGADGDAGESFDLVARVVADRLEKIRAGGALALRGAYTLAFRAGSGENAAALFQVAADLGRNVEAFELPVQIRRLRPGRHQRAAGAWSWTLVAANGLEILGSCDSVEAVLASHRKGTATLATDSTMEVVS